MTGKYIHFDSDEAAWRETFEGWRSADGQIFAGTDSATERAARYFGCTHRSCDDCGSPTEKMYTVCETCREKRARARFMAMPAVEYTEQPVVEYDGDQYFFDEDDIIDYLDMTEQLPQNAMLVECEPGYLPEIEPDHFCDILPEDGELPDDVLLALECLNNVIRKQDACVWWPGNKRILLPDDFAGIDWVKRFSDAEESQ